MAIKFQYNKTSLNDLNKQLKVRTKALPTLKNKESALRLEVKKAKQTVQALMTRLDEGIKKYDHFSGLWCEFIPGLVKIEDVELTSSKVAGVKIPTLTDVKFSELQYNHFLRPMWYSEGVNILEDLAKLGIEAELYQERMRILDVARKRTTQKVNLYEKVQIPGYQEAVRKIKRFLEDDENLSKSAQKIVKKRQEEENA